MIEIAIIKRPAKYAKEVGLFGVDASADEDLRRLVKDEVAWAEITTQASTKLLRFLWAIAQKLADGGLYEDKGDAMDDLKIRARFARFSVEKGRVVIVPRSLSRQRRDVLSRLADRFVHVVCTELLPDMEESVFRKDIEEMVGAS